MKKKCADIFKERLQMAMGTISQRDLAKMSGLTEATISRYLKGERIPKLTDAITLANVLHVSLDYLSGLSEIPNSHNNKVIPLEKALEYCDKQRQMWHEYSLKALKNNNRMDSVGAVALGDRNEVMYGYEIPNILRLLCGYEVKMSKLMDFIWGNSMGEYGLMTIIMTILLILMSVIAIFMVILFIIYIVSVIISDPECQKSYLIETVKCIESEDSSHFIMRPIIIVPLIMTPHHSGSQSATFDYNNLKLKSTESSICNVAKVGKSYKAKIEVRTFPETATVEYGITEIVEAL